MTEETPYILVSSHKDGTRDIHIHNLCVKTPGENSAVLVKDINLQLRKGQRVVFTGDSGTGKTTVAKSLLNRWDHGFGHIVMPEGIKVMGMAQKPYFPDVSLREILNNAPESRCTLDDKELARALRTVGLEKLVQNLPGQQIEIMMDDLLPFIEKEIEPYAALEITDSVLHDIREKAGAKIQELVPSQFSTVQFVPDAQRDRFESQIVSLFKNGTENAPSKKALRLFSDGLIDAMDIALAKPLENVLIRETAALAEKNRTLVFPYAENDIDYAVRRFAQRAQTRFESYAKNEDTDDVHRAIRINETQINHILAALSKTMKETLSKNRMSKTQRLIEKLHVPGLESLFNRAAGSGAGKVFEKAGFIPGRLSLSGRTDEMADALTQKASYFLEKQNIKGRELTNGSYLSGGQKQKLMIAIALLHKPDVLILDEITAALDEKNGEALYRELMDSLPADTIVLSIAHNKHILKYHTHHAHLQDQTVTMKEITKTQPCGPAAPRPLS